MVLAKGSRKTNPISKPLEMAYTWNPGVEQTPEQPVARAIFIPHINSLPFEERRISLKEAVKIGRNVYRTSPSENNAIFECRVLSRHHATLWYDNGHFYLIDNQSSNGTFINNNRCSISKSSEPHEVFSGDIVQFGIAVVENQANAEKNTFPPVVAQLKLYHPDGKEATPVFTPSITATLHLKELYQLNTYVQEAVQREATLESRLRTLREFVERTRGEAATAWQLLVGEQRLLGRVHSLEAALASGRQPPHHHVQQLLDDKRNYQKVAHESLRAAHEQRLALEESLERCSREAASLHQQNCGLRVARNNALAELQKLAARCERKMKAARLAIAAAEEREAAAKAHLPLAYSVLNGEARMLVVSSDSNRLAEEGRLTSLEDAVRALPDYVKLLLPQNLLNKVGIKAVSTEGKSVKDFELIMKSHGYQDESKENRALDTDGSEGEEKSRAETESEPADSTTDDEKSSRLNHDTTTTGLNSVTKTDEIITDDNANSNFEEEPAHDDASTKSQHEYANILRVMAGLNAEIKTLRERLNVANADNEKLRLVRDELLEVKEETQEELDQKKDSEVEEMVSYHERIAELEAQLARAAACEEAQIIELQRFTASTAELQAELALRPSREEVEDLAAAIEKLTNELAVKDEELARLRPEQRTESCLNTLKQQDKYVETSSSLEDLRLKFYDDDTIASSLTGKMNGFEARLNVSNETLVETTDERDLVETRNEVIENAIAPVAVQADGSPGENEELSSSTEEVSDSVEQSTYIKLEDVDRLKVTLQNGTLHALEEELVRAKERWAEVTEEKARLASQLEMMQSKQHTRTNLTHIFAAVVPIVAACVYMFFYQYIS